MIKKIEFKKTYFPVDIPNNISALDIKEGDEVKECQDISYTKQIKEKKEINYKGKVLVAIGDLVEVGTHLYKTSGLKRKVINSEEKGKIKEISNSKIVIEVIKTDENDKFHFAIPVAGKVKKILKNVILIETNGIEIDLVLSKGSSSFAECVYISDVEKFCADPDPKLVSQKIVITKKFNPEYYSTLSAFGSKAIVVLETDYLSSQEIAISSSAFAIVFGYGELKIDEGFKKYISQIKSKKAWLDIANQRLFIFEEKEPLFIDDFTFDVI